MRFQSVPTPFSLWLSSDPFTGFQLFFVWFLHPPTTHTQNLLGFPLHSVLFPAALLSLIGALPPGTGLAGLPAEGREAAPCPAARHGGTRSRRKHNPLPVLLSLSRTPWPPALPAKRITEPGPQCGPVSWPQRSFQNDTCLGHHFNQTWLQDMCPDNWKKVLLFPVIPTLIWCKPGAG